MHERSVNKERYDYMQEVRHSLYLTAKKDSPATVAAYEKAVEARRKI